MLLLGCLFFAGIAGNTLAGDGQDAAAVDKRFQEIVQQAPSRQINSEEKEWAVLEYEYRVMQEKYRMWLLSGIVLTTPILMALVLFCLKKVPGCASEHLVTAVGLILVIEGVIFVGFSAETTEQLTAPIGILGAIAGYLFGSVRRKAEQP